MTSPVAASSGGTAGPRAGGTAAPADLVERAWVALATVPDPEIPAISVVELGIVRGVNCIETRIEVRLTPTYAACPATHVIEADVRRALVEAGIEASVVTTLSPPWTTDWITPGGRAKLATYGIAAPAPVARDAAQVVHLVPRGARLLQVPACPLCGSAHTERLSEFGSTACKALYRCLDCREPFDYFKPL
jgi:ring-1,2-phenylacetyl-CoA epoxidase subunit PaaD